MGANPEIVIDAALVDEQIISMNKRVWLLEAEVRQTRANIEMLLQLRKSAVRLNGVKEGDTGQPVPALAESRAVPQERLKPREAVTNLLKKSPGLTTRQIVSALSSQISTTSNNPMKLLYSTIFTMRREALIETRGGRIFLTEKAKDG